MAKSTKATNQILCAGAIQAAAEAMAFAKHEGLPLERVIEALGKGAGSSWYFVNRAPNMARGTYPPGFRVKLHKKDLKICREMAEKHGVHLPIVEMTLLHFQRLIAVGHGEETRESAVRLAQPQDANAVGEAAGQFHEARARGKHVLGILHHEAHLGLRVPGDQVRHRFREGGGVPVTGVEHGRHQHELAPAGLEQFEQRRA